MKFHRVSLRDYKAIRSFVIEPRETGVTIIEGENEVGKSSIAEALWLVFDQTDDSSSAAVRNLKPAGRDASTEVEVDVWTGQYRFTYFKRFHRGSRTEYRRGRDRRVGVARNELVLAFERQVVVEHLRQRARHLGRVGARRDEVGHRQPWRLARIAGEPQADFARLLRRRGLSCGGRRGRLRRRRHDH